MESLRGILQENLRGRAGRAGCAIAVGRREARSRVPDGLWNRLVGRLLWRFARWTGIMAALVLPVLPVGTPIWAVGGVWTSPASPLVGTYPIGTPFSAAYLVDFKIDGVGATPGDMIAFFDPQGVLCGLRTVSPSDDASVLLVTVYGDDPNTASVDEGATDGDVLAVKVIQLSTARLFQSDAVVLMPGTDHYPDSFPASPIPPVWFERQGRSLNVDTATHFPLPSPNLSYVEYIGHFAIRGAPADLGDEVAVYDPQGILCGLFRVDAPGHYGYLRVYGDDATTVDADEGAVEGDILTFRVWDRSAGIEYAGTDIVFTAGTAGGGFVPSALPPIWSRGAVGYALDLTAAEASAVAGDVNHNAVVDLADAILSLRIAAGQVPALPSVPKAADIDGDGAIGLQEALFVLQRLCGLR